VSRQHQEDRLSALFWHLADRWGRVTPAGVSLDLPLTHGLVAELVGAQRQTVTTALTHLRELGSIRRRSDGCWVLDAACERDDQIQPPAG
jgi:CRP-like cAMP-binding protein